MRRACREHICAPPNTPSRAHATRKYSSSQEQTIKKSACWFGVDRAAVRRARMLAASSACLICGSVGRGFCWRFHSFQQSAPFVLFLLFVAHKQQKLQHLVWPGCWQAKDWPSPKRLDFTDHTTSGAFLGLAATNHHSIITTNNEQLRKVRLLSPHNTLCNFTASHG